MHVSNKHQGSAANDGAYNVLRSRNSVIKSSMTCIEGLPKKLKIYRIAGSRFWQMRYFAEGKYISKSLKSVDLEEAKQTAIAIYEGLLGVGIGVNEKGCQAHRKELKNQHLLHNLIEEILENYINLFHTTL
jgi:hypothetical protein